MRDRIGIAIAVISILISCVLVLDGCQPSSGYVTVNAGSTLMQPTFCSYEDASLRNRWGIEWLVVEKVRRSPTYTSQWDLIHTVWSLEHIERPLALRVSCLTYGEVPLGYRVNVKALPLEPEQFYRVLTWTDGMIDSEDRYFIIRVDDNGTPKRLESH